MLRSSLADVGRVSDNMYYAAMTVARPRRVPRLGRIRGDGPGDLDPCEARLRAAPVRPVDGQGDVLAVRHRRRRHRHQRPSACRSLDRGCSCTRLPFDSAGQWSDLAAGLFSASVLLVGLGIVTWCLGILHTVVGPALHAVQHVARQPLRPRPRIRLLVAAHVRDQPDARALRGYPAHRHRHRHDHRDAPARRAAGRDGHPVRASRASPWIRCSRRTCCGGSATRSCTCCSSRPSPSTTT